MSTDIATLGIEVDSTQVVRAAHHAEQFAAMARQAEAAEAKWSQSSLRRQISQQAATTEVVKAVSEADKFVTALQREAEVLGMGTLQLRAYKVANMDLTEAQAKSAVQSLLTMQAHQEHEKSVASLSAMMTKASVIVGLVVSGLVFQMGASINAAAAVGVLSEKTGIAVERLSALKYAADLSDTSMDSLARSMTRITKSLMEARDPKSEAGRGFAFLGIDPNSIKTQEQAIDAIANAIQRVEDPMAKSAALQMILKRNGEELIPFFNKGADGIRAMMEEGEKWNKVSALTAEQARILKDELVKFKYGTDSMVNAITSELVPALNKLIDRFLEARKTAGSMFETARLNLSINPLLSDKENLDQAYEERRRHKEGNFLQKLFLPSSASTVDNKINFLEKMLAKDQRGGSTWESDYAAQNARANRELMPIKGTPDSRERKTGSETKNDYETQAKRLYELIEVERQRESLGRELTQTEKERLKLQTDYSLGTTGRIESEQKMLLSMTTELGVLRERNKLMLESNKLQAEADAKSLQTETVDQLNVLKKLDDEIEKLKERNLFIGKTKSQVEALKAAEQDRSIALLETQMQLSEAPQDSPYMKRLQAQIEKLKEIQQLERIGSTTYDAVERGKEEARELAQTGRQVGQVFSNAFDSMTRGGEKFSSIVMRLINDLGMLIVKKNLIDPFVNQISSQFTTMNANTGGSGFNMNGASDWFSSLMGNTASTGYGSNYSFGSQGMGYANGGEFMVGGAGGTDSKRVSFRATPGEKVLIQTPGQQSASQRESKRPLVINQHFTVSGGVSNASKSQMAAAAAAGAQRALTRDS